MARKNKYSSNSGFTFLEVTFALFISSIIIWGTYIAYADGLIYFHNSSSRYMMKREGAMLLREIEAFTRNAIKIEVTQPDTPNRNRLIITVPEFCDGGGEVEYFVDRTNNTLRRHDKRKDIQDFNTILLPWTIYRRHGRDIYPYEVREMTVNYGDDDEAYDRFEFSPNSPGAGKPYIVNFRITLAEIEDDTVRNEVTLSTWVSRLNNPQ